MKRKFSFLLVLVMMVSIVLTACGGASPDKVAKNFVDLVKDGKTDKVKELCTDSFAPEAALMIAGIQMMKASDAEGFSFKAKDYKVKEKKADSAVVTFKIILNSGGNKTEEDSQMNLVKEDGKWLIDEVI